MNEPLADFDLLQAFVRSADQDAFASLVRRHLDLVFATAVRKVEDAGAAEEIAQNVFASLVRKAWQFGPDDSLPAWLYKTALLESKQWLRGELRRRRREKTAVDLETIMKDSKESGLETLLPLLDEALLGLPEKDRTVLLLRFYSRQSLREVGASFGVSEDAAQKRVAKAVDRLTQFFQRHGFKTASAALTTAALQHTALSTSGATTAAVIATALQVTPPTLLGLVPLMARLTGCSNQNLAAICLALILVPTVWQGQAWRAARQEWARVQSTLDALQSTREDLDTEILRLVDQRAQLNAALADAAARETDAAQGLRELESRKLRMRQALLSDNYTWPDDSPFVRIPKHVLGHISIPSPFAPPGLLNPEAREILGLSPGERVQLESYLRDHFTRLEQAAQEALYETNRTSRVGIPAEALASLILNLPPLGPAVAQSRDQLMAQLKASLGEQRWPLVEAQLEDSGPRTPRRILGLDADEGGQEIAVWVKPAANGRFFVGYNWAARGSSMGTEGIPLESALSSPGPDGETKIATQVRREGLPSSMTARVQDWVQAQAQERLGKEFNP